MESQFPEIADSQPELVACHCSEAGLIEKAARLWGKAGQRSIGRSALVEGTEQLKRALALIRNCRERTGEIALQSPQPDEAKARACFDRALSLARKQQAKSFELRAAMSLARLWRDQAKRDAARELLAPVHGWFTEGFDTLDLKQAKALLDELT